MSLVLPDWVEHHSDTDEKKKRQTIFSIHVHPDGSRLATGGIDQKIRIWATDPILYPGVETDPKVHKLLCTLSRHTGSVLVVRWSPSGRFLASGSDDTIALIWDLDPSGLGGSSFGSLSEEVNVESWRPHRRLAGHESDIVDLAWSCDPDDSYIATVGLDSRVIVWSGPRDGAGGFERVRVINGHQGFVKGVVWDPIGRYLATASDDKSVKFWSVGDWSLQKTIKKPFERSPTTTFFQRLSWSPDGAHVLCANAMSGPVFVATVVSRLDWTSDIHLVGHENTVVVAAFSPRLFKDRSESPASVTVMALGSLDQSVSVWITGQSRPVLVARDVFQRQVMDLSWSADGLTLYACSADGHIAAFTFTTSDLMEPQPDSELFLAKELYNFSKQQEIFRRSTLQQSQAHNGPGSAPGTADKPTKLVARKAIPHANKPKPGLPAPANGRVQRLDQQITITNEGKRRIRPTLLKDGSSSDSGYEIISYTQSVLPAPASQRSQTDDADDTVSITRSVKRPASLSISHDSDPTSIASPVKKIKDVGRTLGGNLQRSATGPIVTLRQQTFDPTTASLPISTQSAVLNEPAVLNVYKRESAHGNVEARNYDSNRPAEVSFSEISSTSRTTWMDFTAARVLLVTISEDFTALALDDSSLIIYSSKGRRLSSMQLDSAIHRLESYKDFLVALTTDGYLHRWNVRSDSKIGNPVSVVGLLQKGSANGKESDEISLLWVHSNGLPVLITRSEKAYTLDTHKSAFVLIASGWYADCSPVWEGRTRGRGASMDSISGGNLVQARREPVRAIESEINDLVVIHRPSSGVQAAAKPPADLLEDFDIAVTLRHFEMRLTGAALLESAEEYRNHLRSYAKKLSDEGIRNQAEDLCRSLLGPVYYNVGGGKQDRWEASICGLEKRALLSDALKVMGKGRLLLGLVQTYQDLLRNVNSPW